MTETRTRLDAPQNNTGSSWESPQPQVSDMLCEGTPLPSPSSGRLLAHRRESGVTCTTEFCSDSICKEEAPLRNSEFHRTADKTVPL